MKDKLGDKARVQHVLKAIEEIESFLQVFTNILA